MTTLTIGTSGNYTWQLIYTLSQDVEDNTSSIAWTLRGHRNVSASNGAFSTSGSKTFSAIIDGQVKGDTITSFDFRDSQDINFAADTTVITHNADGTHSPVGVAMRYRGPAVSSGFDGSDGAIDVGTPTISLPTIPRATQPTLSDSSRQIGQSTTITLDRASDSFTHDISYAFGSLTAQTTGLSASTGVDTSATFTVPAALVSQMVGHSSQTLTFTVVTKSGSTVIGTKTAQLTITPAGGTVYQRPTVAASVARTLSDGTPADDGVCATVGIVAAVTSVLVSTEQNTLTWKTEVSSDSGSTWQQLGTGTVSSHGLTLDQSSTYTDSDPGTSGTQEFETTSGYLFRVTITDAYSNTAQQIVQMFTAAAVVDFYDGDGDPTESGIGIGALYDPDEGGRIQIDGAKLFATSAETQAGTDTGRAVTPAGLASVFGQGGVPYRMASGESACGTNGSSTNGVFWDNTVTVTLPSGRFTQAPHVQVTAKMQSSGVAWASVTVDPTTTSFTVRCMRMSSYPSASPATRFAWTAVQMTSGSATG
jgi:hypothetical protein